MFIYKLRFLTKYVKLIILCILFVKYNFNLFSYYNSKILVFDGTGTNLSAFNNQNSV